MSRIYRIYEYKLIRGLNWWLEGYDKRQDRYDWVYEELNKGQLISRLASIERTESNKVVYVTRREESNLGRVIYIEYRNRKGIHVLNIEDLREEIDVEKDRRRIRIDKARALRIRQKYKFRQGSVPHVHRTRWYRYYYRTPQLRGAVRVNSEYKEYEVPKYRMNNIPTFDDRVRHMDRSWKTSYKIRKQYMKHLNNHIEIVKDKEKKRWRKGIKEKEKWEETVVTLWEAESKTA